MNIYAGFTCLYENAGLSGITLKTSKQFVSQEPPFTIPLKIVFEHEHLALCPVVHGVQAVRMSYVCCLPLP